MNGFFIVGMLFLLAGIVLGDKYVIGISAWFFFGALVEFLYNLHKKKR
jgi:hypothetical protein